MRPQPLLRARRPLAVGALGFATLATGASAVAQAQNQGAPSTREPTIPAASIAVAQKPRTHVVKGRAVHVTGAVRSAQAGQVVRLQAQRSGTWVTLGRAVTGPAGRYQLTYRTRRTGSWPLRVRFATANRVLGRLNVYRQAYASWYGPGLFGGHLACGGTLRPGTLGVANKSLPCGTKVSFRYRNRTVRVPVIDRGPYVGGREYDLTVATKQRLGFRGHGYVLATR
jgi:rare lipoprotein A (peptidoglycan hydrolase)